MSRKLSFGVILAIYWLVVPRITQALPFLGKDAQAWTVELEKGNASARRGAAFALGKIGSPGSVAALQARLRDDADEWVREACACALGEIALVNGKVARDADLLQLLTDTLRTDKKGVTRENPTGSPHVRRAAAYAVGCMGENAQSSLDQLSTAASSDKSPVVRQNAAWALGKLGPPALDALKKALADADPLVKRDAALSLGEWKDAKEVRPALSELAGLCREDNSEVRRAALLALVKTVHAKEDKEYIADISAALTDSDEEIRNYAAFTLANIGGDDAAGAVPQLLKALAQTGNKELRRQAALALHNFGPAAKSAVPTLIEALDDSDAELRKWAAVGLAGIGEEARDAYLPLLKMLENTQEAEQGRFEAAMALSRMGKFPLAREAVPRLLKIFGDTKESNDLRARVMWAIRVHADDLLDIKGVIPTFRQVLKEDKTEENKMVRYDCAYMLGMLKKDKVESLTLDTLHEFLEDDSIHIFKGAGAQVEGTGVEPRTGQKKVVEQGGGDGRELAVTALQAIGAPTVARCADIVAELRKLARDRRTYRPLREHCEELLAEIKKR